MLILPPWPPNPNQQIWLVEYEKLSQVQYECGCESVGYWFLSVTFEGGVHECVNDQCDGQT